MKDAMTDTQHPLTLYNSLTRQKEQFEPQDPKRVTMYNCGPTVYSYAHIGNARAAVVADVLFRVLRHIYGEDHVVYARNITDVDDKIIASAKEQGVDISVITEKYARIYNEDLAAIGCLPPTHQPLATENIGGMIEMIETLLSTGPDGPSEKNTFAYASDGHVFFDVSKYEDYGRLSGNTLDALRGGDRVGEGEVARKKNAADFVLWKPELDGVGWDAPFGRGRPGWHIECSAMAKETLTKDTDSETIDIHCGGVDLKFPHHENEIAQSNCAHGGTPMANYWVHNEFLNMGDTKMSKSLGNVKLVRDLLKDWDGEVIRFALLASQHGKALDWRTKTLSDSKALLNLIYGAIRTAKEVSQSKEDISESFTFPLFNDLNTPETKSLIMGQVSVINRQYYWLKTLPKQSSSFFDMAAMAIHEEAENIQLYLDDFDKWEANQKSNIAEALGVLLHLGNLLGLFQRDPEEWFSGGISDADHALAAEYDTVRAQAMVAKEAGDKAAMGEAFKASDAIRDTLKEKGLVLETAADGTSKLRKA
jgi:cysteinyl-tRNA synthetase